MIPAPRTTLSAFEIMVNHLVSRGWSRETAEREVRAQKPELAVPANVTPRDEDEVVDAADALMRALGFDVVRLSQKRRSKITPGVPDRYYLHRRRKISLWYEAKAPGGTLRPEQSEFQRMCQEAHVEHVAGGLPQLREWLEAMAFATFDAHGHPEPVHA